MSYAVEIKVFGDPKFYGNGVRFATHQEADERGLDKLLAWTQAEEHRVVESSEPPNYSYRNGQLEPLPEPLAVCPACWGHANSFHAEGCGR